MLNPDGVVFGNFRTSNFKIIKIISEMTLIDPFIAPIAQSIHRLLP